jgi:hypothetical protein
LALRAPPPTPPQAAINVRVVLESIFLRDRQNSHLTAMGATRAGGFSVFLAAVRTNPITSYKKLRCGRATARGSSVLTAV